MVRVSGSLGGRSCTPPPSTSARTLARFALPPLPGPPAPPPPSFCRGLTGAAGSSLCPSRGEWGGASWRETWRVRGPLRHESSFRPGRSSASARRGGGTPRHLHSPPATAQREQGRAAWPSQQHAVNRSPCAADDVARALRPLLRRQQKPGANVARVGEMVPRCLILIRGNDKGLPPQLQERRTRIPDNFGMESSARRKCKLTFRELPPVPRQSYAAPNTTTSVLPRLVSHVGSDALPRTRCTALLALGARRRLVISPTTASRGTTKSSSTKQN